MLDEMGDHIDAVTVSTPDHTHFHAALEAIREGKHVYCQKPLTHSIWEARTLAEEAKQGRRRHPDGQPGPRRRADPPRRRVHPGRPARQGPRGPHLDQPADLAAGDVRAPPSRAGPRHASTGTSGSARSPIARTTRPMSRSSGAAGGTSAPAPSATWAATSWTCPSGRSICSSRRPSRRPPRGTPRSPARPPRRSPTPSPPAPTATN